MHFWANIFFFLGDDQGFPKEEVKTYLIASMSPHNSPAFFLFSYI